MNDIFQNQPTTKLDLPVECLGQTFSSDEARREHFIGLLAEKLKDPEFRKIEGFPHGKDEDILNLSDPPYYTACPNPWLADFITEWEAQKPEKSADWHYHREPFAADVSEGKYDPIYKYHPYPTKVPHKAIMRYILHYTDPGDIVFDGFCGTGMTGVAAQMCGDRKVIMELGYQVKSDGTILQEEIDETGKKQWKPFSKLGARRAVLNDLSPAATFIAYNYNTPIDTVVFEKEAKRILKEVEDECGWMYETKHSDGSIGKINYMVWSDVFICPECTNEVIFWEAAIDEEIGRVKDEFPCPHCSAKLTKRNMERAWVNKFDSSLNNSISQAKQIPVLINYIVNRKRETRRPNLLDIALIDKIENTEIPCWFPTTAIIDGYNTRQPKGSHGVTHVHHFYTKRNLYALAKLKELLPSSKFNLLITKVAFQITKLYRFTYQSGVWGAGGGPLSGTLYIPSLVKELNIIKQIESSLKQRSTMANFSSHSGFVGSTQSSSKINSLHDESVSYIFIDPPFGSNLNYSELAFLWESWLSTFTDSKEEAIENDSQGKGLSEYRVLIQKCFIEAYRILKPGGWMTVEFSNTKASVWNSIQTALSEAGFIIANVSALDKKKGSFKSVTTPTAVKQDLVISCYKPDGSFEERFTNANGSEESVWDFVQTHLNYLPRVKVKGGELEFIAERDPRIIFDRMIAWFVRHNVPVPMSTQEFQAGLSQLFIERDGMVFLSDQVVEYDRKRMQVAVAPQMEMFVSDERSAIDWLSDFLKKRPSTYQDIHPEFISQLGAGWKKHEAKPELSALLDDNFLRYEGNEDVPSQIHGYLSSNYKDLRNLDKNDPTLIAKAKDRWYVPDPNKGQDLEKKRDRALLKEFETYKASTGRKLKEFRLEVLRAGFRASWGNKDYQTIIDIAKKVPDDALQEDEKLLTLYDMALTRTEGN
jgi:DNA modification methylase